MAQNIYSLNLNNLKRGSVSVGRQKPQKYEQQQYQLKMQELNFPQVKLLQQNISVQPTVRQRGHIQLLANYVFEELQDKNHKTEHDNNTFKTEEAQEIGILSKYFPEMQNFQKAREIKEFQTQENPKQLSQSVQVSKGIPQKSRIDWSPKLNKNDESQEYHPPEIRSKTLHSANSIKKLRYIPSPLTEESEKIENSALPKENLIIFNKRCQLGLVKQIKKFPDKNETPLMVRQSIQNTRKISSKQNHYRKFKAVVNLIRAVIKLRILRKINKSDQLQLRKILKVREYHQQYINQFQEAFIQKQHRKFIEAIAKKIITFIREQQFIQECELIWQKEGKLEKDMRRTRFCVLSTLFMQNLEFLTRNDNLPLLLKHQLNICLFKTKQRQISQFVANRALLFSKRITNISQEQKILVVSEYFLFDILTSNLLDQFNDLKTTSSSHKNCSLYYCVSLINLLQTFFIKYYRKLANQKFTNIKPIQRRLEIVNDASKGEIKINMAKDTQLEPDETKIIFQYFQKNQIEAILKDRKKWGENMYKLFNQTIFNLQLQIQV